MSARIACRDRLPRSSGWRWPSSSCSCSWSSWRSSSTSSRATRSGRSSARARARSSSQTVRDEMGLDDPVPVQVYDFVKGAVQGDLGSDFVSHLSVTSLIGEALPHTLILAAAGLGLAALDRHPARRLRLDAAELARRPHGRHRLDLADHRAGATSPASSCCSSSPSSSTGCPRSGRVSFSDPSTT